MLYVYIRNSMMLGTMVISDKDMIRIRSRDILSIPIILEPPNLGQTAFVCPHEDNRDSLPEGHRHGQARQESYQLHGRRDIDEEHRQLLRDSGDPPDDINGYDSCLGGVPKPVPAY